MTRKKSKLARCPYCKGAGKVTPDRAQSKVETRNRAHYNAYMRAYRARKKAT